MRCWRRPSRSSSFAISSRAASAASEARSSMIRFSSSTSGFSNSSSSSMFDEYAPLPQQRLDLSSHGRVRFHRQLLHPDHHLLLSQEQVNEDRRAAAVLLTNRLHRVEDRKSVV